MAVSDDGDVREMHAVDRLLARVRGVSHVAGMGVDDGIANRVVSHALCCRGSRWRQQTMAASKAGLSMGRKGFSKSVICFFIFLLCRSVI